MWMNREKNSKVIIVRAATLYQQVVNVTNAQRGEYSCIATNDNGSAVATANINVRRSSIGGTCQTDCGGGGGRKMGGRGNWED